MRSASRPGNVGSSSTGSRLCPSVGGRKAGRSDSIELLPRKPQDGSKKAQVLAMLRTQDGATIDDLMSATGWQKHSVRGFLATLNKKGAMIESFKSESGVRTYKAA